MQASYQYEQPSGGCSSCGAQASTYAPQTANYGAQYPPTNSPQTIVAPPGTTVIQQNGAPAAANDTRPNLNNQQPATSTYRPLEAPQQVQPTPGANDPYAVPKKDNGAYIEPPKLLPFAPQQDRTAQRNIAPVHTALYQQPASYREISTAPKTITAAQAQQDATGWSSAGN